jgi:hypothetical protein
MVGSFKLFQNASHSSKVIEFHVQSIDSEGSRTTLTKIDKLGLSNAP